MKVFQVRKLNGAMKRGTGLARQMAAYKASADDVDVNLGLESGTTEKELKKQEKPKKAKAKVVEKKVGVANAAVASKD